MQTPATSLREARICQPEIESTWASPDTYMASFTGVEDRVPLARDERRGDRSLVARQDRADALVDGFAHTVDERGVAQPQPGWVRRLDRADGAQHETRGAKTLKYMSRAKS
jgi:hypothetical protein